MILMIVMILMMIVKIMNMKIVKIKNMMMMIVIVIVMTIVMITTYMMIVMMIVIMIAMILGRSVLHYSTQKKVIHIHDTKKMRIIFWLEIHLEKMCFAAGCFSEKKYQNNFAGGGDTSPVVMANGAIPTLPTSL